MGSITDIFAPCPLLGLSNFKSLHPFGHLAVQFADPQSATTHLVRVLMSVKDMLMRIV